MSDPKRIQGPNGRTFILYDFGGIDVVGCDGESFSIATNPTECGELEAVIKQALDFAAETRAAEKRAARTRRKGT